MTLCDHPFRMAVNISVQNATSNRWSLASDIIGILTIGIQLFLVFWWLVPADGDRLTFYILAFVALAGVASYLWHKEPPLKHLSKPSEWGRAIVGSVLMGGISFGIDIIGGVIFHPKMTPIEAGTKAGGPFGFPLTVMLCPGFTMLATAGLLRALLLRIGRAESGVS